MNTIAAKRNQISPATAALVAGFAILLMVLCAPFAEVYVYPKLVISGNAGLTAKNIIAHRQLFVLAILAYTLTYVCDIIAAWALYILLKPVNQSLSLLSALFRWVFAIVSIASLLNMLTALRLLTDADYAAIFKPDQLNAQAMLALYNFRSGFHFGLLFFSIHLLLLGYLVIRSKYIPWIFGILVIITGLGYLATTLKPLLMPDVNMDFAVYTFYGELAFMLWLLIKGWKITAGK